MNCGLSHCFEEEVGKFQIKKQIVVSVRILLAGLVVNFGSKYVP